MTTESPASIGESSSDTRATAVASPAAVAPPSARAREAGTGWLFVSPAVIVFVLFFVTPIVMAVWVSLLEWNGQSNPLTDFEFVGLENYRRLFTDDSLLREDFAISVRNTVYYVARVRPGGRRRCRSAWP